SHSNNVRDSLDCDYLQFSELCYDCTDSARLYSCVGCDHCHNSSDLLFCFDCVGCKNCIGCWGLRTQSYCIFNVPYSKEEYAAFRQQIHLESSKEYAKWAKLCRDETGIRNERTQFLVNVEDCVGDNLVNAKECAQCYDAFE